MFEAAVCRRFSGTDFFDGAESLLYRDATLVTLSLRDQLEAESDGVIDDLLLETDGEDFSVLSR